jgi:hypothetical protein
MRQDEYITNKFQIKSKPPWFHRWFNDGYFFCNSWFRSRSMISVAMQCYSMAAIRSFLCISSGRLIVSRL